MDDREAYEFYANPDNLVPAGPPRKHPKDKLTRLLSVRVSPSLSKQITAAAAAEGRSAGSWVRRTLALALMAERRRRREVLRPEGIIGGSGRAGEPKALGSSLLPRSCRTFTCPHLSVGNVTSVSCGTCGPLQAVA